MSLLIKQVKDLLTRPNYEHKSGAQRGTIRRHPDILGGEVRGNEKKEK